MSVTTDEKPTGVKCPTCSGSGALPSDTLNVNACWMCGGEGRIPDLSINAHDESDGDRYVVRGLLRGYGHGEWVEYRVWDRQKTQIVQSYGSRVGANQMAWGLNLGWSFQEAWARADRHDRWASAS